MKPLARPALHRRRFLISGSTLALGTFGSGFADLRPREHSLDPPSIPTPGGDGEPGPSPQRTTEASQRDVAKKDTVEEKNAIAKPPARPPAKPDTTERNTAKENKAIRRRAKEPKLRPLNYEEEYAEFLAGLDLRYLAPHEIINPHRRVTSGVPNQLPPRRLWKQLVPTLRVADEIRKRLGVPLYSINSAYRCPPYNRMLPGAARNSYHTRNQALDLVYGCSPAEVHEVATQLRGEGFFRGGIGLYSTFLHIDTRGYIADWRA